MSIEKVTTTGIIHNSVTIQNVLHFSNPDGTLDHNAIAANLIAGWMTQWAPGLPNQFRWFDIAVQTVGSAAVVTHHLCNVAGTGFNDLYCHPCLCLKVRLHTPVGGRHGRGRIYMCPLPSNGWDSGIIRADQIANWITRAGLAVGPYLSGGGNALTIGVLKKGGSSADFIQATSFSLSPTAGIQRRRNIGVGI